jgi:GT2 family glycosyltransferase
MKEKLDYIVIIPSHNRADFLKKMLEELRRYELKYKIKYVVFNDASDSTFEYNAICNFENCTLINNPNNNGLKDYWKTINTIFLECKKYDYNWIIQADDDFEPTSNFFEKFDSFTKKIKEKSIVKLHYPEGYDKPRWGFNHWVDGGAAYPKNFIEAINYKIDEIPKSRWNGRPRLSDGVWHQLSQKLNNLKYTVQLPDFSFFNHLGIYESKMFQSKNEKPRLITKNFIK